MRDRDGMKNDQGNTMGFTCPTCKRPVRVSRQEGEGLPRFFPFCSERCKLVDLGAWFNADYRIAGKSGGDAEASLDGDPPVASGNDAD